MTLRVVTPKEMVVEQRVTKVTVRAEDGSRTFLPRHIDFVTALAPSVIAYVDTDGAEGFAAVDEGVATKIGDELLISTPYAAAGIELGSLRRTVEAEFRERGEHDRAARTALARLEASIVRRFIELGG